MLEIVLCNLDLNPIPPGGWEGGGGGRKVPAPISTFENFLDIEAIPTKCGHFY